MGERIRMVVAGARIPPETFLDRLFRGLHRRGIDVLIAARSGEARHATAPLRTVPLRSASSVALAARRVVGGRRGDRKQLLDEAALLSARPDLLYFPWNSGAVDHVHLLGSGIPTLVSCRGSQLLVAPHNPDRANLVDGLRQSFAAVTAVHCVSEQILREAEGFGLDRRKATVIRPAVPLALFTPRTWDAPASGRIPHVVSVGSLIWRKGFEFACAAVRNLEDAGRPVHLTIVGEGAERQRIRYTIEDLGIQHRVDLAGSCAPHEVAALLQTADCFWLPSLAEGISNAALEAMASGVPVIVADVGGMAEAVTDGVEGFVVRPRDADGLADATLRLLDPPERRSVMGTAARARIERDFDVQDQIDAFATLVHRLVGAEP